jgi:prepilin-type N-terminal cleavage/methylation domain-containing protein
MAVIRRGSQEELGIVNGSKHVRRGFTLLEVLIALSVLATGALVALTVLAGTSQNNEQNKEQVQAFKAAQDMMEVLMSMNYTWLLQQRDWAVANSETLNFDLLALPKDSAGNFGKGVFSIADVTSTYDAAAPPDSILEIRVAVNYRKANVLLTSLRYKP